MLAVNDCMLLDIWMPGPIASCSFSMLLTHAEIGSAHHVLERCLVLVLSAVHMLLEGRLPQLIDFLACQ